MKKVALITAILMIVMLIASCAAPTPPVTTESAPAVSSESPAVSSAAPATSSETAKITAQDRQWKTSKGTFVLADRIVNKINNGEKLVIRISLYNPTSPYAQDVKAGMKKAAEEIGAGADCELIGPPDASIEGQIAELETLIDAGQVDGLAISSGDADTIMPIIKKSYDAGIPVLTYDLDSPNSYRLSFFGVNLPDVGDVGAAAFMDLYPKMFDGSKDGKALLLAAIPSAVYARTKFEVVEKKLKDNGFNMKLVGPFELGLDMAKAYSVVENAFMANPDTKAVYVADEYVESVGKYLTDKGLAGKVLCMGCNTFAPILAYVESGAIQQTTGYNPYGQGYNCINVIYNFLAKGATVDELNYVKCDDVRAENVKEFKAKLGM